MQKKEDHKFKACLGYIESLRLDKATHKTLFHRRENINESKQHV